MSYLKQFQEGPLAITVSESAGQVSVSTSFSAQAGGGSLKGAASASLSASVSLSSIVLIDAGLAVAAEKFPSLSAEIALIKAALDAEVAKA